MQGLLWGIGGRRSDATWSVGSSAAAARRYCCTALLLHVAVAASGALQRTAPPAAGVDVELKAELKAELEAELALMPEPAPELQPPPEQTPPPKPPALSPRDQVAMTPRPRLAAAALITRADAERGAGSASEAPTVTELSPEPDELPRKRLSLAELGLTGTSAAILPPLLDAPARAPEDVAGLKRALAAQDVALGLGPGGAVAHQLRQLGQELAPLASVATISVDLNRSGAIDALWLDDCTSNDQAWRAMLRAIRLRLADRPIASVGPVRVTLLVTSRSSKRSGSAGITQFDVSNIGSPTLHTVHVRVLSQSPL